MTMSFGFASAWFGQEIKNPKFICRRRDNKGQKSNETPTNKDTLRYNSTHLSFCLNCIMCIVNLYFVM
jgi:hypothetical protein